MSTGAKTAIEAGVGAAVGTIAGGGKGAPSAPVLRSPPFQQDSWHVSVSPYLWLAGLDANVNVLRQQSSVHQSFGDILSNPQFGVMGLAEVRRGRLGILTDLLCIRIGDQKAIPIPQLPSSR